MKSNITRPAGKQPEATAAAQLFDNWFDPVETAVRERVHEFIQNLVEEELNEALSRARYVRHARSCAGSQSETPDGVGDASVCGHRHGHRSRSSMGTFGQVEIDVPRARIDTADGKTTEWRSKVLPVYRRRTKAADAPIAGAYLAGTNERTFIVSGKRSLAAGASCARRRVRRRRGQGYGPAML